MTMVKPLPPVVDHNEVTVESDANVIVPDMPAKVRLSEGVPGLSDAVEWTIVSLEAGSGDPSVFSVLATADDPDTSLIVADPWAFFTDYSPDLPDNELEALGITSVDEAVIVCPVTLDAVEGCFYLNLLGPLVFHATTGAGRQMVLGDQDWPVRARVDVQR